MNKQNDYQVLELSNELRQSYLWDGRGWRYARVDFANTEEEQTFVSKQGMVLISEGTQGTWPMRIYRQLSAADLVVQRVMNAPVTKRQQEDW